MVVKEHEERRPIIMAPSLWLVSLKEVSVKCFNALTGRKSKETDKQRDSPKKT